MQKKNKIYSSSFSSLTDSLENNEESINEKEEKKSKSKNKTKKIIQNLLFISNILTKFLLCISNIRYK